MAVFSYLREELEGLNMLAPSEILIVIHNLS